MGQKRCNSLSVLNAHTDIVDNLSLIELAERFANAKKGVKTNLGYLLKKSSLIFFVKFFLCFSKN